MYNYFFGKKHASQRAHSGASRMEKPPESPQPNSNAGQSENKDPGLAKATAFKNKLNSKLNLEALDPNNMMPLRDLNEGLAECKVCARHFSPQRIGTHQSICERMTQRDSQDDHPKAKPGAKPCIPKPAPIMTRGARARQKLVVRPQVAKPKSSLRKLPSPPTLPSKTLLKVTRPRPVTAKPDLNNSVSKKVNCVPSNEQASSSKSKRPLSAYAFTIPKMSLKPKVEIDKRVACPICQRKFNQTSAAHHIPWCTQQASLIKPPKPPSRKKYVVPKLRIATADASAPLQKPKPKTPVASNAPVTPANRVDPVLPQKRKPKTPVAFNAPVTPANHVDPALPQKRKPKTPVASNGPVTLVERVDPKSQRVQPSTIERKSHADATNIRVSPEHNSHASRRRPLLMTEQKPAKPGRQGVQASVFPLSKSQRNTSSYSSPPNSQNAQSSGATQRYY